MKVIVIGAAGTIGQNVVRALKKKNCEVVTVGRSSGDFKIDMESESSVEKLFKSVGKFDALVVAAGEVTFVPLAQITEKIGRVA